MAGAEIERLMQMLSRLPGLGPRSGRRAALHLLKRRDGALLPLLSALQAVADKVRRCSRCGSYDTVDPCHLCCDPKRQSALVCVVEDMDDREAIERTRSFQGSYHVLGGLLSPLDGIGPSDLNIPALMRRVAEGGVQEVILALPATVDGQTTAHYISETLRSGRGSSPEAPQGEGFSGLVISALAHGVPVGGELDHLDDGTLSQALRARRPI